MEDLENILLDILSQIGSIGLWLKTVEIVIIIWILFQGVQFYFNMRRLREISKIKKDMKRMEDKLDKILKK